MKTVSLKIISSDECMSIQLNGLMRCATCKWTGISACNGKNIIKTGRNTKGYRITESGIDPDNCVKE